MKAVLDAKFDEVFHRFDALESRWDSKLAGETAARQQLADATDRWLAALEEGVSAVPGALAHIAALESSEPSEGVDRHLAALEGVAVATPGMLSCITMLEKAAVPEGQVHVRALEEYCAAQADAVAETHQWARGIDDRAKVLEEKVGDLEMIHLAEMRDERDDHIEALEDAAKVFDDWRPWVEAAIYDVRRDFRLFVGREPRVPLSTGPAGHPGTNVTASAPPAATPVAASSWGQLAAPTLGPGCITFSTSTAELLAAGAIAEPPNGHCVKGYGSVTTIATPDIRYASLPSCPSIVSPHEHNPATQTASSSTLLCQLPSNSTPPPHHLCLTFLHPSSLSLY